MMSAIFENRARGVIAAGIENRELALLDPSKILEGLGFVVPNLIILMGSDSDGLKVAAV
jgi:hypothetical protein